MLEDSGLGYHWLCFSDIDSDICIKLPSVGYVEKLKYERIDRTVKLIINRIEIEIDLRNVPITFGETIDIDLISAMPGQKYRVTFDENGKYKVEEIHS